MTYTVGSNQHKKTLQPGAMTGAGDLDQAFDYASEDSYTYEDSPVLVNKLHITDAPELARQEELLTKRRAIQLYDTGDIGRMPVRTFQGLSKIHKYLFQDVYEWAGETRTVNISKGGFGFAPVIYLEPALENVSRMPEDTYGHIVEKYVEMNVAHPFREGNGRSTRIWLDQVFKKNLGEVVDWSKVGKDDYLLAMERSPVKDTEIKHVLAPALTPDTGSREVFMKGLDASYWYEGYKAYPAARL